MRGVLLGVYGACAAGGCALEGVQCACIRDTWRVNIVGCALGCVVGGVWGCMLGGLYSVCAHVHGHVLGVY